WRRRGLVGHGAGDVRRQDRRTWTGRGRVQGHAPPVHAWLVEVAAAPRYAAGWRKTDADRRLTAGHASSAEGLPLLRALHLSHSRQVRRRNAAADSGTRGEP